MKWSKKRKFMKKEKTNGEEERAKEEVRPNPVRAD
jgi:hypothetical protein